MFNLEVAGLQDVFNLQNWINRNGYIARDETAYLACRDLLSIAVPDDAAITWSEELVGDSLACLCE